MFLSLATGIAIVARADAMGRWKVISSNRKRWRAGGGGGERDIPLTLNAIKYDSSYEV